MREQRTLSAAVALGSAAAALALVLAGCTPAEPDHRGGAVHTPSSTSQPAGAGAPDEAAPLADPAQPATWRIGFGGVGPLVLGAPTAEQRDALSAFPAEAAADGCALRFVTGPSALRIGTGAADGDALSTIALAAATTAAPDAATTPRTAAGIGLGSTIDEVVAAYPEARKTSVEGEGLVSYAVTDASGRSIVFGAWRTDPSVVTAIQVGPEDRIVATACGLSA